MLTITTPKEPERSPLEIDYNGKVVHLGPREAQVLRRLIAVSKDDGAGHCTTIQLYRTVWKRPDEERAGSVVSCVMTSIRKKLPGVIAHDPGRGYRIARGVVLGHS